MMFLLYPENLVEKFCLEPKIRALKVCAFVSGAPRGQRSRPALQIGLFCKDQMLFSGNILDPDTVVRFPVFFGHFGF